MKKTLLLFVLITAFLGVKAQDQERKQLPPDLDMLRTFYILYMMPYYDGSQPTDMDRKQSQVRRTYSTPRAQERYLQLMQAATTDDDAFIKAPGANAEAMRSLEFVKVPNQTGRYKVSYQLNESDKITIELALIKNKEGEWKIDYLY
jgi:hypothetical protein